MSRSAVVLLLLGAAACAYAAEEVKSSPLFDKWMYQRASTKVHSASYKDIETEHVCLVPKTKENCRCFAHVAADCHNQYSETPVACCGHPARESPLDLWADMPTIGRCKWSEKLFDTPIGVNNKAQHIGNFEVVCEMDEDSDKCSDALCDGMKLFGVGEIMTYSHVAFTGLDADAAPLTCEDDRKRIAPAIKANTPAKIQYAHDEEHRHSFYLGEGVIYIGGFKVVSHLQPAKYQAGKIQLAFPTGPLPIEPVDELPSHDYYVTKNRRIELEFIKADYH